MRFQLTAVKLFHWLVVAAVNVSLSIGRHYLDIQSVDSKREKVNVIEKCAGGHIILGEDAEQQTAFTLVIVHFGWNGRQCNGIGIGSEGYGLKPNLFLQPEFSQM